MRMSHGRLVKASGSFLKISVRLRGVYIVSMICTMSVLDVEAAKLRISFCANNIM